MHRPGLLAALLYLGLALWAVRVVLPAPASTLPYPRRIDERAPRWQAFTQSDQKLTVALTSWNARTILTHPTALMDGPQCHPLSAATTLGEHMLGLGLRAIPVRLLSADPILTFNVVLVVTFWLAAFGMYLLVHAWTGSVAGALVAGLLFGFYPGRIADTPHPYVFGNHWTPFALLFAHRLFTRGRWRDALGLAAFVGLQIVEGAYPMLALGLLGGVYGAYLLARHRRTLPALAPKLLVTAVATAGVAAAVLLPYARTRAIWGALSREGTLLYDLADFGWGQVAYPGSVLVALALVAIGDRVRGARWPPDDEVPGSQGATGVISSARRTPVAGRSDDPRLAYLTAGLVVLWASVREIAIPWTGIRLPSLFTLASAAVPGLDAVRVVRAVASGVLVAGAFLAGYGMAILAGRPGPRARVLAAAIGTAALLEVFWPPLARLSFGGSTALRAYHAAPPPAVRALQERMADGAVVDLPLEPATGGFWYMGEHVLRAAYHGHRIASCYNSFRTPVQDEVEALAARVLEDPRAGAALSALGFRNVVVHLAVPGRRRPPPRIPQPLPPHLVEVGQAGGEILYHLRDDAPVVEDLAALARGVGPSEAVAAVAPRADVPVTFRNATAATYRHPEPIRPTPLLVRWYDAAGKEVAAERVTLLLPLALAAGDEAVRRLPVAVPAAAGRHRLTVAPEATPELVIGAAVVDVTRPRVAERAPS